MDQEHRPTPALVSTSTTSKTVPAMNCLVLAGGGAKGAYGAGAAKALFAHHKLQRELGLGATPDYCFLGTSAGALNACILAALGPDQLVSFWNEATKSSVLGIWSSQNAKLHLAFRALNPMTYLRFIGRMFAGKPPFSLYSNKPLRKLITSRLKDVEFAALLERNLVICTTNYSTGKLASFYVSKLIDGFKATDNKLPVGNRRIGHFVPITSKEMLIDALLASTAIPTVFPPVQIGDSWYVDGGVGNNIPIRETAYFLRYLNKHLGDSYRVGETFCVTLDEPGKVEDQHRFGIMDLLWRTYNVFEYIHMRPIVEGWSRINKEVADYSTNMDAFQSQLAGLDLSPETVQRITEIAKNTVGQFGGATSRLNVPLHLIEPGGPIGDLLLFESSALRAHVSRGYKEAAQTFLAKGFVDAAQHKELLDRILTPAT